MYIQTCFMACMLRSLYTLVCFTGQPGDINIISSQRPNVIISWTAPTDSERWSVLYRVTISNGTSNISGVEGTTMTMVVLPNLTPLTNYTLSVFVYTESGCLSDPTSVNITVMESEWCCYLDLMKAIIVEIFSLPFPSLRVSRYSSQHH